MSKKVVHALILFLIVIAIFTGMYFGLLKMSTGFSNENVRTGADILFLTLYIILDLVALFWFLLYWWSDRKWTRIKNKFKAFRKK